MKEATKFNVAAATKPGSLAGAIAQTILKGETLCLQSIGAGAVNQANKAVAIASSMLAPTGIKLAAEIAFQDLELDGMERTAIVLHLKELE